MSDLSSFPKELVDGLKQILPDHFEYSEFGQRRTIAHSTMFSSSP